MNGDYPRAMLERQVGRPGEVWVGPAQPDPDPVHIVDPDPAWAQQFTAEATRVSQALRGAAQRVEHVGSTSVPGLPAKPLATSQQGQGFATELGRAAHAAAFAVDQAVPFIAWIAGHNLPSRRVAERLGLTNFGSAVDPSDNQPRLAYADRPLDALSGE